jgi:SAM-dependent methyltransferase
MLRIGLSEDMNVFDEMGKYWAEIADKNQTKRQVQFIKNTLKPEGLVLDLACGTGRHMIPLSEEGYSVVGLDESSKLLWIAKNHQRGAEVVRADMRFFPFKPQAFIAAVSIDTSFGYLPSEQDDLQSLSELHAALSLDGVLIIDVFNRERLIKRSKANRLQLRWKFLPTLLKHRNRIGNWILFRFFNWKKYPSFFLLQKRTVTKKGKELRDLWTVCDKTDGQLRVFEHVARLYTLSGLKCLLEKAGFKVMEAYGDYEKQSLAIDSSRLIFIAGST